jgi:indole-3-glycerol phosphate synthase / phosphoribosylanthranilate isomerase
MKGRTQDIRQQIFQRRISRIRQEGPGLSSRIPDLRTVPLTASGDLFDRPQMICEIKRASPSKGLIDRRLDPVTQAGIYVKKGIRVVSVLTEEDHFHGSLDDLMQVKQAFPELAVLRKDFLCSTDDIDVSYRAGADLVLLIASLLTAEVCAQLYHHAAALGMGALVEVHSSEDIEKVRALAPKLTGINSRDLKSFTIDRLFPVRQRQLIDWSTTLVYESGIWEYEDAFFAGRQGFSAVLCGESVVRDPERISSISRGLQDGCNQSGNGDFWSAIAMRRRDPGPLVKICGITRDEDARMAVSLGADVIGFICAPSEREVTPGFIRRFKDLPVLKAAVVVHAAAEDPRYAASVELLEQGYIDVIQLHGDESPQRCSELTHPYYKALRVHSADDVARITEYRCPRTLIDAYHPHLHGGTGRMIDQELVMQAAGLQRLWIAGGITPETVSSIVRSCEPELIDISSGVESGPGVKDHTRMSALFDALERYDETQ